MQSLLKRQQLQRQRATRHETMAGFTLLEMLVIVVILAILFGIAAPSWLAFTNSRRANNGRDQVLQAIRLAQTEALRTKTRRQVRFDTTANPPVIIVAGADSQGNIVSPEVRETLGDGNLRPGAISLQIPLNPSNRIVFNSDGVLDQRAGVNTATPPYSIVIKAPANQGRARCVVLETLLGSTRSVDSTEASSPTDCQ